MNVPSGTGGDHVIDLYFHLQGKQIDVDHGYALYGAISRVLESTGNQWLHDANDVGLLPVRGRYVGQGKLALGRGARFGLRLPATRIPSALALAGKRLEINGDKFLVGTTTTSALIPAPVLYAHLATTKNGEDEARFDEEIRRQLQALDINGTPQRGPRRIVTIKDKKVVGYSLLITGLTADESIRLQEQGLGGRRKMGCGMFVARKDSG